MRAARERRKDERSKREGKMREARERKDERSKRKEDKRNKRERER